ncbi:hypothetical protein [Desulfonatronospira sp.]|uniref:hypothetical protein n=1 Tax=Desulfonatronospira sp. TaxID=1962951 RepID=UPI0025BF4C37|nr:hypothetical protein [Desulfonatronospira sp.]
MTHITAATGHPASFYSLVEQKTSSMDKLKEMSRVKSTQKSMGFKWKNISLEYSSEHIQVSGRPPGLTPEQKFMHAMYEAGDVHRLSSYGPQTFNPGATDPATASRAYQKHKNMDLTPPGPPMLQAYA